MPFTSNIDKTLIPIAIMLKQLNLETELNKIASDSISAIKNRLSRGLAHDGTVLDTKARNRIGRYGKWHGENRRYAGLKTNVRDLNFTGDMIGDFGIIKSDKSKVTIGFSTQREAQKALQNEEYMDGIEVFIPNDLEIIAGKKILDSAIEKILQ